MRSRWSILSAGAGAMSLGILFAIASHSGDVRGDTTRGSGPRAAPPSAPTEAAANALSETHDPNTPYPLGPGAIPYEQLSAADKAALDQIQETVETSQPPSSYQAWENATAATGERAQVEIAARGVGLVGTEQDAVVP